MVKILESKDKITCTYDPLINACVCTSENVHVLSMTYNVLTTVNEEVRI